MVAAASPKNQLRVGRVLKAHGLKGALKLELYTDDPDGRFVPGASFTLQAPEQLRWHRQTVTVREFRWMNASPVIFFEGIEDRTEAETLCEGDPVGRPSGRPGLGEQPTPGTTTS